MNAMNEKRFQQLSKRIEELEKTSYNNELWKSATYSDISKLADKIKSTSTLMVGTKKDLNTSIDMFKDEVNGFRQKMDEYEHVRMEKYYSQVAKLESELHKIKAAALEHKYLSLSTCNYMRQSMPVVIFNQITETLNRALTGHQLNSFIDLQKRKYDDFTNQRQLQTESSLDQQLIAASLFLKS